MNITFSYNIKTCYNEKIKNAIDVNLGNLGAVITDNIYNFSPKRITNREQKTCYVNEQEWEWAQQKFPLLILSVVNIFEGGGLFWEKVFCIPETEIYFANESERGQLVAHLMRDGNWDLEMLELKSSKVKRGSSQKRKIKKKRNCGRNKCALVLFGANKYLLLAFPLHGTTSAPIIIVKPRELSRCWKGDTASTTGLPMETLGLAKYYHGSSDKQCGLLTTK